MSKFYTELDEKLQEFIVEQTIFYVVTVDTDGRSKLSLNGMNLQNLVFARMNMWVVGVTCYVFFNDLKCLDGW